MASCSCGTDHQVPLTVTSPLHRAAWGLILSSLQASEPMGTPEQQAALEKIESRGWAIEEAEFKRLLEAEAAKGTK